MEVELEATKVKEVREVSLKKRFLTNLSPLIQKSMLITIIMFTNNNTKEGKVIAWNIINTPMEEEKAITIITQAL